MFVFHAVERGIDRPARDFPRAGQFFDLGVNGDAIGVVVQREDRGEDDLFELAERVHHLTYMVFLITDRRQVRLLTFAFS